MKRLEEVSCKIVWNREQVMEHLVHPLLWPGFGLLLFVLVPRSTEPPASARPAMYVFAVLFVASTSYFISWRGSRVAWQIVVAENTVRCKGLFGTRVVLGNSFRGAGHRSLDYIGGKIYLANEYEDLQNVLDAIEERFPDVPPLRPY